MNLIENSYHPSQKLLITIHAYVEGELYIITHTFLHIFWKYCYSVRQWWNGDKTTSSTVSSASSAASSSSFWHISFILLNIESKSVSLSSSFWPHFFQPPQYRVKVHVNNLRAFVFIMTTKMGGFSILTIHSEIWDMLLSVFNMYLASEVIWLYGNVSSLFRRESVCRRRTVYNNPYFSSHILKILL